MNSKQETDSRLLNPETWVEIYGDYLFRYAVSKLRDPSIAEDIVQETFFSALQNRENFASRSSERTWLVGILKHKIADYFRKISSRESANNSEPLENIINKDFAKNGHWRTGPSGWANKPDKVFEQKEFWQVLRKCLSELPDRFANAFFLCEMEGLKTEEICKVLNISTTNYWVMLHRARYLLRHCPETNWFGSGQKEE